MAQGKRLHLSYERMALLVSGAPAYKEDGSVSPLLLSRVQDISYGFDYGATQLREIGSHEYIKDRTTTTSRIPILWQPTVGFQFSYLFFDALNEKNIGLNVGGDGIFVESPLYRVPDFDGNTFDTVVDKGDVNFFVLAEDSSSRKDILGRTSSDQDRVKASGQITFNADGSFGNLVGSTVKIGGHSFSQGSDWNYINSDGQSNLIAAASLASAINSTADFSATSDGPNVNIESSVAGPVGNSPITLSGHSTISSLITAPAALAGGKTFGHLKGLDLIGLGNCYISRYSINASLGSFVTCSLDYQCSNMTFDVIDDSVLSPAVNDKGARSGQVVDIDEDYLTEAFSFVRIKYDWAPHKNYSTGDRVVYENESYEALQPSLGHAPSTSPEYWTSDTNASLALSSKDMEIKFTNNKPNQDETQGFHSVDFSPEEMAIQSIDLSLSIDRKDINGFGSNYMKDRKMQFPILATLDVSLLARGYEKKGQIANIFNDDIDYDVEIYFFNRTSLLEKNKRITIKVLNAKLNSESHTNSIGGFSTIDASFLFEVTPNSDMPGMKILSH
ncbi:MAG: hypothetical protein CL885_03715 [Dehalococcoidia bacterium]|nr:hypothetical protein [Dehalococcoidia bacterium]